MSSNITQWLTLALFVMIFAPITLAEILWLVRNNWCTPKTAFAFSLATNGIGMALSLAVMFVTIVTAFMLVLRPAGTGNVLPNWAYSLIFGSSVILTLIVLIGAKLLLFRMMKIRSGREALLFSAIASVGFIVSVLVIPSIAIYFLG
jgi:hypothetical protein